AAGGVDRVSWFGEPGDRPVEAYATAVAEAVAAAPGVLLSADCAGDRVLLGAAAARLQAPALTGASAVSVEGDGVLVTRSLFGGIAAQTVAVTGPVALVLDGGPVPTAVGSAPIEEVAATPLPMTIVATTPAATEQIDLSAATRVVGIGRGLKAKADLDLISVLAGAAAAEVGCSRPLAEGLEWLGKDRYIGVSGENIAPELYFAIGISGQLQHMVGVREATTIVAINSDPNAPVFTDADYGLVGDLYQIVPALIEALK
ncbi:MAG TPA: electron transfer flavoprotein subunit alpha/FixB family protein, partial [Nakamurella sp.]